MEVIAGILKLVLFPFHVEINWHVCIFFFNLKITKLIHRETNRMQVCWVGTNMPRSA